MHKYLQCRIRIVVLGLVSIIIIDNDQDSKDGADAFDSDGDEAESDDYDSDDFTDEESEAEEVEVD